MNYYVFHHTIDSIGIEQVSKSELEERLDEGYWGLLPIFDRIPQDLIRDSWGECLIIIKGDVVVPEKKEVIIKHVLD